MYVLAFLRVQFLVLTFSLPPFISLCLGKDKGHKEKDDDEQDNPDTIEPTRHSEMVTSRS